MKQPQAIFIFIPMFSFLFPSPVSHASFFYPCSVRGDCRKLHQFNRIQFV